MVNEVVKIKKSRGVNMKKLFLFGLSLIILITFSSRDLMSSGFSGGFPPNIIIWDGVDIALVDSAGNAMYSAGTLAAGENLTNKVLEIENADIYTHITADAQIGAPARYFHSYTINKVTTAGDLTIYDNTAESGTVIAIVSITTDIVTPMTVIGAGILATGLYFGYDGTLDVDITTRHRVVP